MRSGRGSGGKWGNPCVYHTRGTGAPRWPQRRGPHTRAREHASTAPHLRPCPRPSPRQPARPNPEEAARGAQ